MGGVQHGLGRTQVVLSLHKQLGKPQTPLWDGIPLEPAHWVKEPMHKALATVPDTQEWLKK
jgi:hypothetical protein